MFKKTVITYDSPKKVIGKLLSMLKGNWGVRGWSIVLPPPE